MRSFIIPCLVILVVTSCKNKEELKKLIDAKEVNAQIIEDLSQDPGRPDQNGGIG